MDSKFIELHDTAIGELLSVNVENICYINAYVDPDGMVTTAVGTNDGSLHVVSETYDQVKQMIRDSGIHIHKADPRLDTSHPLTMADLKEMIGEPVWNSNTGKWTLVRNYIEALEPYGVDVAFLLDAADNSAGMTAGDLIKFPLYRMRRTLD